jgi:hypothetical protein
MARGKFSGPRYGSRAYQALFTLHECGEQTEADWMSLTDPKQTRSVFMRDVAQQLLAWGLVAQHGNVYRIREAGLKYLGVFIQEEEAVQRAPAPGRYAPPRRDLSAQHRPALRVTRPGAFDYRDVPSVYAGKAVAYRSSITVEGKDGTA